MKTWLFTNVRDEKNIAEWCAFHLLVGFDRIVVFDHLSKTPVSETLTKWIKSGHVEVRRIDWNLPIKSRCMKHAVSIAKNNNVDWMLYLDGDEYLALHPQYQSKVQMYIEEINKKTKKPLNMIALNWLLFGSNGHSTRPTGLVIDNYVKCASQLDVHVKCIVRPQCVVCVTLPHFFHVKGEKEQVVNFAGRPIQVVGNEQQMAAMPVNFQRFAKKAKFVKQGYGCFNFDNADPLNDADAFVAHYDGQSYDTYLERKVNRFRDDIMRKRNHLSESVYHKKNNDVVFARIRDEYSSLVAEKLSEPSKQK